MSVNDDPFRKKLIDLIDSIASSPLTDIMFIANCAVKLLEHNGIFHIIESIENRQASFGLSKDSAKGKTLLAILSIAWCFIREIPVASLVCLRNELKCDNWLGFGRKISEKKIREGIVLLRGLDLSSIEAFKLSLEEPKQSAL